MPAAANQHTDTNRLPSDVAVLESGKAAMTGRFRRARGDSRGVATIEIMLISLGAIGLLYMVSTFVLGFVRDTGEKSVAAETVLAYSPARYCVGDGDNVSNTGVPAAVIQSYEKTDDTQNGRTVHQWRFRLSRSLSEPFWDADFNGDGDVDDIIGNGADSEGGFVVLMYEPDASTGNPFSGLPSDEIVFAGSTFKASMETKDFYDWPETKRVVLLPGGVLSQLFSLPSEQFSDTIKRDGLYRNASILPNGTNGWEGAPGARLLRTLNATTFPATGEPTNPQTSTTRTEGTLDAGSVAFLADVVVNRPGGCWTVRFLS